LYNTCNKVIHWLLQVGYSFTLLSVCLSVDRLIDPSALLTN
jgi:hypothetical protein